jgi:hypothetical protein
MVNLGKDGRNIKMHLTEKVGEDTVGINVTLGKVQ